MADGDGNQRRIEPRLGGAGRGLGGSPERIAELEQRAATMVKLLRPDPARPFAAVLAATPAAELPPATPAPRHFPVGQPRPGAAAVAGEDDGAPPAVGGKIIVRG